MKNQQGIKIGLDEVGRGCLAGPVVAAGAILKEDLVNNLSSHHKFDCLTSSQFVLFYKQNQSLDSSWLPFSLDDFFHQWLSHGVLSSPFKENVKNLSIVDSKILSEKKRKALLPKIMNKYWVGLSLISPQNIDRMNILQASLLAMKHIVEGFEQHLKIKIDNVLIDGNQKIPHLDKNQIPIIKGDAVCEGISAASIVAKVFRDDLMKYLDIYFPYWGFAFHKGYPSRDHRLKIKQYGPSPLHRLTFQGVL